MRPQVPVNTDPHPEYLDEGRKAGGLFPTLGRFLDRQLVLLLFFFLFKLLLFLLASLIFILLTAFFSHRVSPFVVYYPDQVGRGSQSLPRINPLYSYMRGFQITP